MEEFPCTQCGECCRRIGNAVSVCLSSNSLVLKVIGQSFPYSLLDDGSCEKFKDGKCSIYDERPLLCRIKEIGEILGIGQQAWFSLNADTCNKMIREAGLDSSFLIPDFET
jgi:Fe-S-cluster containining protein